MTDTETPPCCKPQLNRGKPPPVVSSLPMQHGSWLGDGMPRCLIPTSGRPPTVVGGSKPQTSTAPAWWLNVMPCGASCGSPGCLRLTRSRDLFIVDWRDAPAASPGVFDVL